MEAKDTVIRRQEIQEMPDMGIMRCVELAKRQAEISFKAGQDDKERELGKTNQIALAEGRKLGIREVVEWIREYAGKQKADVDSCYSYASHKGFCECSCTTQEMEELEEAIQAKLKEWGI